MSYGGSGSGSGSIHSSSDVALSSPTDSQVLAYSVSLGKWQNTVVNEVVMPAGTPVYADYNFTSLSYPTRPTSRTDVTVVWRGPTAPPTTTGYALANDEWRVKNS